MHSSSLLKAGADCVFSGEQGVGGSAFDPLHHREES